MVISWSRLVESRVLTLLPGGRILLCDEPKSALDVDSSRVVLDTLKRLARDPKRGVVLVTHDPRVFPYADRLVKIEDGRIASDTKERDEG